MSALSKAELAEAVCGVADLDKRHAVAAVECFFEELKTVLEEGHSLKLSGFGNFALRDKKARPGCNPRTGEPVMVKSRRVVTFKAGEKLKDRLKHMSDETPSSF